MVTETKLAPCPRCQQAVLILRLEPTGARLVCPCCAWGTPTRPTPAAAAADVTWQPAMVVYHGFHKPKPED